MSGAGGGRRWLAGGALVSIAAIVTAFFAGMFVRSPWAQASANAEADPLVTVAAAERDFTPPRPVVTGSLSAGREVILDLPAGQDTAVITQAFVKAGSSVSSGTALVEISGRPVLALDLPFGLYRSITPGDRGSDVIAVQKALSDLKLYPRGGIDGIYGTATSRAVEALYAAARVSPPTPDPERTARLRAAQDALRASSAKPGSSQLLKLARARDLAAAAAATPLPANEIVALRGNDLRLVNVPRVGTVLAGDPAPTLRLRGGTPSVTGRVSVLDAEAYADGTKVSISSLATDREPLRGTVIGRSEFRSDDPAGYDLRVEVSGSVTGWEDDAKVAMEPAGPEEAITALGVPLTALREDAEGSFVWVKVSDETVRRVGIEVGAERDGFVAVASGELATGDLVVVAGR